MFHAAETWAMTMTTLKLKLKLRSFKSSEHINEKVDGPYSGFNYQSHASDPLDLPENY